MNIRGMKQEDIPVIQQIYEEQYKEEFEMPDFVTHFIAGFVAHDDENQIISAGGIRTLAECITITDRRQSHRQQREALYNILAASRYICEKCEYNSLHAFVDPGNWENILKKVGFVPIKGNGLILSL